MILQDFQVLQRDADDKARVTLEDGTKVELAVGGPYEVGGAHDVWVGDLWLLTGQSNMEGCARLDNPEPPQAGIHCFETRERWALAEEPLHWLNESPRVVHHNLWGFETVQPAPNPREIRTSGAGPALAFAKRRYAQTGVPIGLIPSAHGGTSMDQWSPAKKSEGDRSLYGATCARLELIGGKIAGILWYQGESDAYLEGVKTYPARFEALVAAFRAEAGNPNLPIYFVQIGRFDGIHPLESAMGWGAMRECQRRQPATIPHSAVVATIDLDLDDGIHIGSEGVLRLGKRLADVANGQLAPDLRDVSYDAAARMIYVRFDNVRGGLQAPGRPAGFSLRTADNTDLPVFFKISLAGDTARIHLDIEKLPDGTTLWYGFGMDPYCNITDAEDGAVPAFGPIPIE